jgi:hypothetical protein
MESTEEPRVIEWQRVRHRYDESVVYEAKWFADFVLLRYVGGRIITQLDPDLATELYVPIEEG